MQITILSVAVENKGKYNVAEVAYKGDDGKVSGKKIMSFTIPEVFEVLKKAQPMEVFDVKTEKDDKGYWQWVAIVRSTGGTPPEQSSVASSGKATPSPRSTYETPEERAKRQVLIVRQSSLSAALNFLELTKNNKVAASDVLEIAERFTAWVFEEAELITNTVTSLEDTIPY